MNDSTCNLAPRTEGASRFLRRLGSMALSVPVAIACLLGGCTTPATTYPSPASAVDALIGALEQQDRKAVQTVFGSAGDEIISSGDAVSDRAQAQRFLDAYKSGHELVEDEDGYITLMLGPEAWPFPIPLVRQGAGWAFDCEAGEEEILNRRIGANELYTISVCMALVDAQREFAQMDPDGDGLHEYAAKFASDPGKRNGLYWEATDGAPESPLGPILADAAESGYELNRESNRAPVPFHGYLYRTLSSQGPAAPGGARPFDVSGRQIGGFAFVASPAEYGNSGVMTFIVGLDGVVYERDLGDGTAREARSMKVFNPGEGWKPVARADE